MTDSIADSEQSSVRSSSVLDALKDALIELGLERSRAAMRGETKLANAYVNYMQAIENVMLEVKSASNGADERPAPARESNRKET